MSKLKPARKRYAVTRVQPRLPKAKAAATESTGGIDLDAINAAVAAIRNALPKPRVLTKEVRQQLFKMADKRAGFVQKALGAVASPLVQAVLPPSFNRAAFEASAALFVVLNEVLSALKALASDVDDTAIAEGSDAMNLAAKLYTYVKEGAEDNPGLKPIAEDLGESFKKASDSSVVGSVPMVSRYARRRNCESLLS